MKYKRLKKSFFAWLAVYVFGFLILFLLSEFKIIKSSMQISLATIGINIILGQSLNLIIGVAGQFSLGHAAFMGIGAYATALTLQYIDSGWGFYLGMLVGAVISIVFSLIISIPTLRLKGDYLAIATLGFGEIIRLLLENLSFTNGASGIAGISKHVSLYTIYIFIIVTTLVIYFLYKSKYGRALNAIKNDEMAASSVGLNVLKYRVLAFLIGAVFASIGGSLYASYFSFIRPSLFGFDKTIEILIVVVLGGLGNFTGVFIAAIILGINNILLGNFVDIRMIMYALILIMIMLFKPQGLLGKYEFSWKKVLKEEAVYDEINN